MSYNVVYYGLYLIYESDFGFSRPVRAHHSVHSKSIHTESTNTKFAYSALRRGTAQDLKMDDHGQGNDADATGLQLYSCHTIVASRLAPTADLECRPYSARANAHARRLVATATPVATEPTGQADGAGGAKRTPSRDAALLDFAAASVIDD